MFVLPLLTNGILVAVLYAARPVRRSSALGSTLTGLNFTLGRQRQNT